IMTKYPDAKSKAKKPKDLQLQAIIDAVRAAVTASSCIPRLASDGSAHGLLWDHIELYLLGCRRGIAIVEDKYRAELNPNVAMEWGWMRAMGKPVLFLMEKSFKEQRADLEGARRESFSWTSPDDDIREAVARWLEETQL
ncbi:MAG TPA: hypothetical protein VHL59_08570, partial [Thermoanaerobaculia bacterium]|nr:hypothetical protein [Thermoanaerobaculia bacterium]